MTNDGWTIILKKMHAEMIKGNLRLQIPKSLTGMHYMDEKVVHVKKALGRLQPHAYHDFQFWHRKLGHPSMKTMLSLNREYRFLPKSAVPPSFDCKCCLEGKLVERNFARPSNFISRASKCAEIFGVDLVGPFACSQNSSLRSRSLQNQMQPEF